MTDLTPQLEGKAVTRLELHLPAAGVWFADCVLAEAIELSGRVTLTVGAASYVGTIDPQFSGVFAGSSHYRVVGGSGGWGKSVPRLAYANDAGVKAITVAKDAAAAVGEAIGAFVPSRPKFSEAYVRRVCLASQVLEDAAGGVPWWVGADGKTNVSVRPQVTPDPKLYHVATWDPIGQIATISVEDPMAIQVGSVLTDADRFSGTQIVRDLTLRASGSTIEIEAWCGTTQSDTARLPGLLAKFITHTIDPKLLAKWRYRVESVGSDGRVDLKAINKDAPVPSLKRVPQVPGVAGCYSDLAPGAVVHIEFLEGDASQPIVGPGSDTRDPNFVANRVTLGGKEGADIALKGGSVHVLLPPMIFSGTISGAPASGVMVSPLGYTLGTIENGSSKAGAAQ